MAANPEDWALNTNRKLGPLPGNRSADMEPGAISLSQIILADKSVTDNKKTCVIAVF